MPKPPNHIPGSTIPQKPASTRQPVSAGFPEPLPSAPAAPSEKEIDMPLLDYFAGQALGGYLAGRLAIPNTEVSPYDVAELAYQYAEAMLSERVKHMGPREEPIF